MDTKIVTADFRLRAWTEIIHRRTESGLSVKEWCLQNGVSRDKYFYWLRKVKTAALEDSEPAFAEITPAESYCPALPDAKAAIRVGDLSVLVTEDTPDALMVRMIRACRHAQ